MYSDPIESIRFAYEYVLIRVIINFGRPKGVKLIIKIHWLIFILEFLHHRKIDFHQCKTTKKYFFTIKIKIREFLTFCSIFPNSPWNSWMSRTNRWLGITCCNSNTSCANWRELESLKGPLKLRGVIFEPKFHRGFIKLSFIWWKSTRKVIIWQFYPADQLFTILPARILLPHWVYATRNCPVNLLIRALIKQTLDV